MVKLLHLENLNNSPAGVLATKGWLETLDKDVGDNIVSVHWSHKAILAIDGEDPNKLEPVGVLTWTHQEGLGAVYIEMAYVEPQWRRRGVFKAMYEALLGKARMMNVPWVRLGTSPKNEVARHVYEREGGEVFAVFYRFPV